MGAARAHGIIDAVNTAGCGAIADTASKAAGPRSPSPTDAAARDLDTGRTGPCQRIRKRSTPPTPDDGHPVNGSTPS